jgi:hypothetical protein
MKDVKITFSATDLNGCLVTETYTTYLSSTGIRDQITSFKKQGYAFTIVSRYTNEVLAQSE